MQFILLAQTNAAEGRDEDFNRWYDQVHLKEVLNLPGFGWAQRFTTGRGPFQYYALYGIEADSSKDVWTAVTALNETMTTTDAIREVGAVLLTAIGERVTPLDYADAASA